ncbi:hypothetical protein E2320_012614 [Naja naja]|nr:hypothetical protein E2320_012614 [Naja naja]
MKARASPCAFFILPSVSVNQLLGALPNPRLSIRLEVMGNGGDCVYLDDGDTANSGDAPLNTASSAKTLIHGHPVRES